MNYPNRTSKIQAAFAALRRDPMVNKEAQLTIEWVQPAPVKGKIAFGAEAGKSVLTLPREFSGAVLKPFEVDVIRLHENGEIAWDRGDGNAEDCPNIRIGLDQVLDGQHVYSRHDKPLYSQQPLEVAYQFPTAPTVVSKPGEPIRIVPPAIDEAEVLIEALSNVAGRQVNLNEITFEEQGVARVAHVDDAKIKMWFDTYFQAESTFSGVSPVLATDINQEKLDTVCMSFAAKLASDPYIDFIHLSGEDQRRINHSLTTFLGMLQLQYYQDDFKRTIDTAIELGKCRKLSISHSPRIPPSFWNTATQVVIPKMGAWVGNKSQAIYSAFAPVVLAHPSYANNNRKNNQQAASSRQLVKPIKPALPAYLLG